MVVVGLSVPAAILIHYVIHHGGDKVKLTSVRFELYTGSIVTQCLLVVKVQVETCFNPLR